ncbi:GADD45GIP1 family protein [Megaselia abdita]
MNGLRVQRIFPTSRLLFQRNLSSKEVESTTKTENEVVASFVEEPEESKPESFFNKSRLLPQHRRMLMKETPYDEPQSWIHLTEKYQRKMYGKYGSQSKVDPKICFPTSQDLEDRKEYESVAYPFTLQEMMQKVKVDQQAKKDKIMKREEEISVKLEKLEQWKTDLKNKIAKKESEALVAKQRKDRLIEEVRRHFGFNVDPKDERFKELLEAKEKEDKKKQKEVKKKAKEEKMMAKLVEKTSSLDSNGEKDKNEVTEEAK